MKRYVIDQQHGTNWEPIPEGEFTSKRAAQHAIAELRRTIGWTHLRIVREHIIGNVIVSRNVI